MNELHVPTPKHGDKQTTIANNMLVCMHQPGKPRKFFYMSPDGKYKPHVFTVKNRQFLNKTEWDFLFSKTQKVEVMTPEELALAEELFGYIIQNVTSEWSIADIKKGTKVIADQSKTSANCTSIRGLDKVANLFA